MRSGWSRSIFSLKPERKKAPNTPTTNIAMLLPRIRSE